MLFRGLNSGGRSVSPSSSRTSTSIIRAICEIGTSFAPPSKGFSVLSPTCCSEVYIQEITMLNGITSQIRCRASNSFSTPNGGRMQNRRMNSALMMAYCRGRKILQSLAAALVIEQLLDRLFHLDEEVDHHLATGEQLAARRLLEDSPRNVDQIARLCGFGDEERMRVTFRRHLGVAPRDYRRRFAVGDSSAA